MSRIEEILRRASRRTCADVIGQQRRRRIDGPSDDGLPWDFAEPQDSILEAAPAFAPAAPALPSVPSTRRRSRWQWPG